MNAVEPGFPLVVDHVYIWVSKGGPEMRALQDLGLKPHGRISVHEGQGTASQSVLFRNMYLELVWVEDQAELAAFLATATTAVGPPENWEETGLSPFGIGLHYHGPDATRLPLETELVVSSWMPEGSSIEGVPYTSLYVPSLFILHGPLAYWDVPEALATHPLGLENLTELAITGTDITNIDPLTSQLAQHGVVRLSLGASPLMELTFDHRAQGKSFDARPTLPLVIHY